MAQNPQDEESKLRVNKKAWRELKKHGYSQDELESFYIAIKIVYRIILASRPDAIIAPLRGAEPLIKSVQLLASLEGKSKRIPPVHYPRTGEQTAERVFRKERIRDSFAADMVKAMTDAQKEKELPKIFEKIIERHKKGHPKILLLDEVFQGGSIVGTLKRLDSCNYLRGNRAKIFAIGIANEPTPKNAEYKNLLNRRRIREIRVKRLFTIDSPQFIYPLVERMFLGVRRRRPMIGVTRRGLTGKLDLYRDLSELHTGRYKHVLRLPTPTDISRRTSKNAGFKKPK